MIKSNARIALLGTLALSSLAFAKEEINKENHMGMVNEELTTEIGYEKGSPFLDASDRKAIDALMVKAKGKGKIEDVKVLSWADREYPTEGNKAEKQERDLAGNRAKRIRQYLKDVHKIGDVDAYNMAERPNALEKLFSTADYEVKTSAENAGTAPTEKRLNLFRSNGRSSTALVVVEMED